MARLSRQLNERRTIFGLVEKDLYIAGFLFVGFTLISSETSHEWLMIVCPALYLVLRATVLADKKPSYLEEVLPALIRGGRGYVRSTNNIKTKEA